MTSMWILILVLSTDSSSQAGAASVRLEHKTLESCTKNYDRMVAQAVKRDAHILIGGCYKTDFVPTFTSNVSAP